MCFLGKLRGPSPAPVGEGFAYARWRTRRPLHPRNCAICLRDWREGRR